VSIKKRLALFEGLISAVFWGFGYVASVWALESFSVSQSLALRFFIVGFLFTPVLFIKFKLTELKRLLRLSFLPGVFLVGEIYFQLIGLRYTTPTKAAFITVLFVVLVPLIEALFYKIKINKLHWLFVLIALLGTGFLATFKVEDINWGDLFMFMSALFVSFHILSVSKLSQNEDNLFSINLFQCFWAGVLTLPFLIFDPITLDAQFSFKSVLGLAFLTFGTTLLAFYFQMRSQKELNPSTASVLFLLESPLAALFSYLILNEMLSLPQMLGCCLIFLAVTGVTFLKTNKSD